MQHGDVWDNYRCIPYYRIIGMKLFEKIFIAFCFILAAVSCKKEEMLSVNTGSLVFTGTVNRQSLEIKADGAWRINAPVWIECNPASGSGNAEVVLEVPEEHIGLDYSDVLTVTGKDRQVNVSVSQKGVAFQMEPMVFEFGTDGKAITASIISQTDWTITDADLISWLDLSALSGSKGKSSLTLTPKPITDRTPRTRQFITLDYGKSFVMLTVSQTLPNTAPGKAELVSPGNAATDININPSFSWKAAIDPDGDELSYKLMISKDNGATWSSSEVKGLSAKLSYMLEKNTVYKWKIQANDPFGGSSESDVYTFTTGEGGAYRDGEVTLIQRESAGAPKPVHLVFIGDGFIEDDFIEGGAFDKAVNTAIDAFFTPEPYASYKEYFRISTVAAYSQERGATVLRDMRGCPAQTRNTAFGATLEGGNSTGTSCNYEKVLSYAQKVQGVGDAELKGTTVLLLINLNVYAGTCLMYYDGRSVSMCPMGTSSFRNVVMHEAGGHGFGRLLDEYRYYNESLPSAEKDHWNVWRAADPYYGNNITIIGDREKVHWKDYFTRSGYDAVGLYEGAFLYYQGAWRPEYISCMEDNRPYYNAPSREAIVRRIMKSAGKTFDINEFLAKDVVKSNAVAASAYSVPYDFIPLAPPIRIE